MAYRTSSSIRRLNNNRKKRRSVRKNPRRSVRAKWRVSRRVGRGYMRKVSTHRTKRAAEKVAARLKKRGAVVGIHRMKANRRSTRRRSRR